MVVITRAREGRLLDKLKAFQLDNNACTHMNNHSRDLAYYDSIENPEFHTSFTRWQGMMMKLIMVCLSVCWGVQFEQSWSA